MSFTFNGVNSDSLFVKVEHYPVWKIPNRKYNTYAVPGRDGVIYLDTNSFDNVSQPYDIVVIAKNKDFETKVENFISWLNSTSGYCRLEDTKSPNTYRKGVFIGNAADISNSFNIVGRATITFDCMPYRWLKSGETAVTVASGGTITNPTLFASKPLIKVTGSGAGTLTIGGTMMTLNKLDDYIYIDCDSMDAYRQSSEDRNSYLNRGEFIMIPSGAQTVTFTGGITGVQITPRWVTQ